MTKPTVSPVTVRASRRFLTAAVVCLLVAAGPARAQLAPPNEAGVTLSHIHLTVSDIDAHTRFWTSIMGGTVVSRAPLPTIAFPGVYIVLEKGQPAGPPAGSVLDHFGFVYRDIAGQIAHWKAVGADARRGGNDSQGYVWGPDQVRVEYYGDPAITTPVKMDHFHLFVATIPAAQAWYESALGGRTGERARVSTPGIVLCNYFPGMTVSFNPGRAGGPPPAPTKGRAIDHFGFDVKDLGAFVARLQAQGVKVDVPPHVIPGTAIRSALVTDPWGTSIELTENFASAVR